MNDRNLERKDSDKIVKNYRFLLFDMDGTLADTSEGVYAGLDYAIQKLCLRQLSESEKHMFLGPPLKTTFIRVYSMTEKEAEQATAAFREYYSRDGVLQCSPYPGIRETLEQLYQSDYKLFVATSKPTPFAEAIVKKFCLNGIFAAVIGSNLDNTRSKKAEIIQYILDNYCEQEKRYCLMVGDTKNDIDGANECSIDSAGVLYGFGTREELIISNATYIITTPSELLNIV